MSVEIGTRPTTKGQTWLGQSIQRKEDDRLLRGQGEFVDDIQPQGVAYVHFVRSPYGHARIRRIDVSRAEALPGVLCTMTGEEVSTLIQPFIQLVSAPVGNMQDFPLALRKVRFMGEPVVAVVAETRNRARDAAALVDVEYEPLPAVVDAEQALQPDAPLVHEEIGTNVSWQGVFDYGDIDGALARADTVVKIDRLHFDRFAGAPLETNGGVASYDRGTDTYTLYCNNQLPGVALIVMATAMGIAVNQIRLVTRDIGGAFGNKITSYTYLTLICLLARKCGRPVKWTEYRSEQMSASGHGGERTFLDLEVPVMNDGTILGFKVRAIDDCGAYLRYEPLAAVIWSQVTPGVYQFKDIRVDFTQVITNKCPTTPNRGYSRMQHLWMIERLVDIVARELDFDPIELRKKNYIKQFPYETPNKCIYDSGDYVRSLDTALDLIGYESWKKRQEETRGTGKLIGIGIGTTVDSGTNNFGQSRILNPALPFSGNNEAAHIMLDLDGAVVLTLGSVPQGQSHETTAAQVVADVLGITPDQVRVRVGLDTARNTYSGFSGTIASQFAVTGIGAAHGAAEKLRREIVRLAAAVLGGREDEIVLEKAMAKVAGDPDRSIPLAGLAGLVHFSTAEIPPGCEDITLNCIYIYRPPFKVPDVETKTGNLTLTYAMQLHVCVVEVDQETGVVEILDYAAVDDSGTLINPVIVEGQVHGAAAQGIGSVLQENFTYSEDGELLNTNYYDYLPVTSLDVPHFKTAQIQSPSPFTVTGAKGMGEGGGCAQCTVTNAVQDAVWGYSRGIVTDLYNPSERVYSLLHEPQTSRAGLHVTRRRATSGRI